MKVSKMKFQPHQNLIFLGFCELKLFRSWSNQAKKKLSFNSNSKFKSTWILMFKSYVLLSGFLSDQLAQSNLVLSLKVMWTGRIIKVLKWEALSPFCLPNSPQKERKYPFSFLPSSERKYPILHLIFFQQKL